MSGQTGHTPGSADDGTGDANQPPAVPTTDQAGSSTPTPGGSQAPADGDVGDKDKTGEQQSDGDIVEGGEAPGYTFYRIKNPPPDIDTVRRNLAVGLVLLLAAMVAFGAWGWFKGHDLQTYILLFSPVVTLVGTVLGFYFSDNGK